MTMHNIEIANIFNELADLLEIAGENPYRVRAYRNAAQIVLNTSIEFSEMVRNKQDLTEIPGIGVALAEKILTLVKTGKLPQLKEVEKRLPKFLSQLMKIEGLGPKRVKILYDQLQIKNLKDLELAIIKNKIRTLPRFGEKTENLIKKGMMHISERLQRYKLASIISIAKEIEIYLKKNESINDVMVAGSYRRCCETVGDLDFLVTASKGKEVIAYFVQFSGIAEIVSQGSTRSTVRLHMGMQIDLRVIPKISYGAALLYFTGSKSHCIALRNIAIRLGYKLNEYGLYKNDNSIASKTENEIYKKLNLTYIEPELRENRGELIAAEQNNLPYLINLSDIKGDLHCHTDASDGQNTLDEMVYAAEELGLEYIAITDHSKHLAVIQGMDEKKLLRQIKKIDQLNAKLRKLVILKSIEVDILENGELDLPNDILKELDLTVCSIHTKFNLSEKMQTERVIRAMDNPYFTILAHPTGRLIGKREPYHLNMERIIKAAKERGCILEINAQPERLDLNDVHCQMAKSYGVKFVISTDAHSIEQFHFMQFGIYQARRGWISAEDVINTRPLKDILKLLKR